MMHPIIYFEAATDLQHHSTINWALVLTFDLCFRFCLEGYYPLDPNNKNKYIISDDYIPVWKVRQL